MNKGASPDGDRAAGLRPQPAARSSQSSIPSAAPRDPDDDGAIEWVVSRLTPRQFIALEVLADDARNCGGWARAMGVSPATLNSLWDFRRGERECWAPLMLTSPEWDWNGRRVWGITRYGREVLAQAMSAFGQDPQGLEAKPASAVPAGDAPDLHSSSPTPTYHRGEIDVNGFRNRLPAMSEQDADSAFLHLSRLRDRLVLANERVAAELVESAIATLQDACRELLRRAA